MGNRLSKIVTKTGDAGTTGLAHNIRVAKDHPRIEVIGTVDELNAHVGLALAYITELELVDIATELAHIQHDLFDIGGALVMPEHERINARDLARLEQWIDGHNQTLSPLKEFILPSGSFALSQIHVCRTVARRAERALVHLNHSEALTPNLLKFVNRLSDYFFVLARVVAKLSNQPEIYWENKR